MPPRAMSGSPILSTCAIRCSRWAVPNDGIRLPMYKELFEFTEMTCAIWEQLSFGAGAVKFEVSNQIDAYRESADAFWSKWEACF